MSNDTTGTFTSGVLIADNVSVAGGSSDAVPTPTLVNGNPISAALEIKSTTGALVLPRVTEDERDAMTVVDGAMVYETGSGPYIYDNGAWDLLSVNTASVNSITGTANEIAVSNPTGDVILSLPVNVHVDTSLTVDGITVSSGLIVNTADLDILSTAGNIVLEVPSTGAVKLESYDGLGATELQFYEATGGNHVGFKAGALSTNTTWTLPLADSTGTQYLRSNGSGDMSWGLPVSESPASITVDGGGDGDYTTITAALAVATSGMTIWVKPGTYTENFSTVPGVSIEGADKNTCIINGTVDLSAGGTVNFLNLGFTDNAGADIIIMTGATVGTPTFYNCNITALVGNAVNITSTSVGSNFIFNYCALSAVTPGSPLLFIGPKTAGVSLNYSTISGTVQAKIGCTGANCTLGMQWSIATCPILLGVVGNTAANFNARYSRCTGLITVDSTTGSASSLWFMEATGGITFTTANGGFNPNKCVLGVVTNNITSGTTIINSYDSQFTSITNSGAGNLTLNGGAFQLGTKDGVTNTGAGTISYGTGTVGGYLGGQTRLNGPTQLSYDSTKGVYGSLGNQLILNPVDGDATNSAKLLFQKVGTTMWTLGKGNTTTETDRFVLNNTTFGNVMTVDNTTGATAFLAPLSSSGLLTLTGGLTTTGTAALSLGEDASAQTIAIGTGGAVKTITIGSTTGASVTNIRAGSGSLNITSDLSSTTGFLGFNQTTPLAAIHIEKNSTPAINNGNARFLMGRDGSSNPFIEMHRGAATFTQASAMYFDWAWADAADYNFRFIMTEATTLTLTKGGAGTTFAITPLVTMSGGLTTTGTGTISIGADASAQTINIGSGGAAKTIAIGSVTGGTTTFPGLVSHTALSTFTGGVTTTGTSAINISADTNTNTTINIGTGAGTSVKTIAIGNTTATSSVTISSGASGSTTISGGNLVLSGVNLSGGAADITTTGEVLGGTLYASGDLAGVASTTSLTNVSVSSNAAVNTLLGTTPATPQTNAGYLKMYLGTTPIYVPYWTTT